MRSAFPFRHSPPSGSDATRSPLRRRVTSFGLAIAAHVLIFLLLMRLAPAPAPPPEPETLPSTFSIAPAPEPAAKPAPRARTTAKSTRAAASAAPRAAAAKPAAAPTPAPTPPPPKMLAGGMDLFEAADIGKLGGGPGGSSDADGTGDSASAYGPGEGPGGQRLFNAEWYREPSRAELAGYIPAGVPPGGWAMIACRTIEDFHVENCRSLGEGPAGSGLARAMRQAAWQFRVRPPRLGGKTMIGAWVRIRFDFDRGKAQ